MASCFCQTLVIFNDRMYSTGVRCDVTVCLQVQHTLQTQLCCCVWSQLKQTWKAWSETQLFRLVLKKRGKSFQKWLQCIVWYIVCLFVFYYLADLRHHEHHFMVFKMYVLFSKIIVALIYWILVAGNRLISWWSGTLKLRFACAIFGEN